MASLNTEWESLALLPPASQDGTYWATSAPALSGMTTIDSVLRAISDGDRDRIDAILHALLGLHAAGEELAGRVVLQTMLGRVVRMRPIAQRHKIDAPEAECVAAQWEAIATYPLHLSSRVAAHLSLNALNLLLRAAPAAPAHKAQTKSSAKAGQLAASEYTPAIPWLTVGRAHADLDGRAVIDACPTTQAVETLLWARETGALSEFEIELLTRVHLNDESSTCLRDVGAAMGMSHSATRQRYSRTIRKLRHAVQAALTHPLAG